ncbi:hypothetical protein Acsp04_33000 [Actinomadura sp. NBRC 104425]|uniref:DMT family transporter n=1 Tax=Actinomadura sp. NBRC 104425 TaxID=3032204 RepID=UPI0024A186F5|nr:DMT family transporter [Actinomadura sp. NBRC 104425]GLZ13065.1 hypothetical protein Acsp04_33000 [Actinomadura sp. NBRC 104425]
MTLTSSTDRADTAVRVRTVTLLIAVTWALLWAGAFVATKLALHHAAGTFVVGVRCAGAGLVLLALRRRRLRTARTELLRWSVAGLLTNTGYLGVMGVALPHLSAGMAAVLSAGTPLLVLGAGAVTGSSRLRAVHVVGLVLGVGGIVLSALDRLDAGAIRGRGVALGVCAVIALAASTYLTPRLVRPGSDPLLATGWQALVGAVPLLVAAAATGALPPGHIAGALAGELVFLIFGASVLGMTLWLLLIQRVGPGRASVAQFMPPLFSVALGMLFLGESVSLLALLAVIPVAVSTVLTTRP